MFVEQVSDGLAQVLALADAGAAGENRELVVTVAGDAEDERDQASHADALAAGVQPSGPTTRALASHRMQPLASGGAIFERIRSGSFSSQAGVMRPSATASGVG